MWDNIRQIEKEKEEKRAIAENMRESIQEMDYQKKRDDFFKYNEKSMEIIKHYFSYVLTLFFIK